MARNAPTAEQLLAHTDWLMQLARALVGDSAAADVVQDTYEVALSTPPRHDGPLRPWLGGVARNLARMATRGRVRRERREEQVAPAFETPSPEELVARVQMQQQVARIVLELAEPLRSTLLLRFFEGMTAAEIARAQGIPAATVRSRLKDALDRIRATLDRQHGGERRRWVVLVAPFPIAAASRGAVAASLAGGILVKTGIKVLVGIVVVLALVLGTRWLGWWGGTDTPAATTQVAKPVPAPAPGAAAAPIAGGPTRALPAVFDDDPKGTLRLEGQVIDEHDQPVGGAHVAIDANPPIVVDTEGDGSFVFEGLIPRDYRLEASAGDRYAGPARLRLTANPEPITLRMRRGGVVEVVTLERPGGKPVAGAMVELRSTLTWRATTNADGVAQLRGVGAGWSPIAVRAAGFSPTATMVQVTGAPEAPQKVAIALSRGAELAGRVLDDAGKPVAGARVVATSAAEPFPVVDPRRDGVVTGADGAFAFPVLAAGTWRLTATQGDHSPATSEPLALDGVHPRRGVDLVLGAGGVVRGMVRDTAGNPVPSAEVRVVVRGHVEWRARRQALSSADGRFAIVGLPRRDVDVVAWHETGASAIASADLVSAREQVVDLVLDVRGSIAGTVVDRSGAPVGDAQVIAMPEWSGGVADRAAWGVRGIQEAVTDQAGAFRFTGLPEGSYRVRAARPGAPESALALSPGVVAKPNDSAVKVVIPGDGRIVGKIAFGDGTAPIAFTVAIGSTPPTSFAGKDGAFELAAIGGKHALTIAGPGFVEKTLRDVAIAEGKDTDVGTITVTAGRSISGRVLDESGAPVAGARVAAGSVLTGGGSELYIEDESINAKTTETDAAGRFTIEGFGPTVLTVLAGKDGVGRSPSQQIPPGPDSATLDIVLQRTAGLEGKLTRSGAPAGDIAVIAKPLGAIGSNFFVLSGPDGQFVLDALAPGTYLVSATFGEGGNRPKDIYVRRAEVVLGKRGRVDIDATPGPITVTVAIKTDKGGTVPMAQVIAMQTKIDAETVDGLRDGTRLPIIGSETIPTYMRIAQGGTVDITGVRPGVHSICAIPITGPVDDPGTLKSKCAHATLGPATKQRVEVVIPASWLESK